MSDYSEQGAEPVVDAAVADPPTVDELLEAQERDDPRQASTRLGSDPAVDSIDALPDGTDADGG
jgi:hypothetical protein